nr:MAG TPA: hypothetical protein [Caudoviricetes sp.]
MVDFLPLWRALSPRGHSPVLVAALSQGRAAHRSHRRSWGAWDGPAPVIFAHVFIGLGTR